MTTIQVVSNTVTSVSVDGTTVEDYTNVTVDQVITVNYDINSALAAQGIIAPTISGGVESNPLSGQTGQLNVFLSALKTVWTTLVDPQNGNASFVTQIANDLGSLLFPHGVTTNKRPSVTKIGALLQDSTSSLYNNIFTVTQLQDILQALASTNDRLNTSGPNVVYALQQGDEIGVQVSFSTTTNPTTQVWAFLFRQS